ncbi:MAG: MFS transporter, partial [Gemmatimonadetes bacterium]|nr:MFS transporter [Gemmatimonadota bacterium]
MSEIKSDDFRTIASWCLFDWANSAFTTLVVTFIYATYFSTAFAPDEVAGTALWSRGVGLSAVIIALLSPILGAAADKGGKRKRYLAVTTITAVIATTLLAFIRPGMPSAVLVALGLFVVGNVGFELGMVFYNSFLPTIASPGRIGRVSGYGWGVGYVGGLVCLVVALVGFVQPETPWFGISKAENFNIRATNLLVAGWFAVFSLPLFLFVRERPVPGARFAIAGTLRELQDTVRHVRRYGEIVKYLLAHLIYNDGLVTIFAFGAIYAAGTFGMSFSEVILFGIVLNVVAGLGALGFGFVDDKIGGKKTVMLSLVALSTAALIGVFAPSKMWLWVSGVLIGGFAGPNQAASRSLMGRFSPVRHQTEFFGFFALSGKVTSFMGPIALGTVAQMAGTQRAGIATVIVFFVAGGLL